MEQDSKVIQITLTQEQASAVCDALDAYSRLCMGQLEEVANMVRFGVIPMRPKDGQERTMADADGCDEIADLAYGMKAVLGLHRSSHLGIGHRHMAMSGLRSYEVKKVLAKTVAELRNPNPAFRSVDYDGLGPRYTSDPEPMAIVVVDTEKAKAA